MSFKISGLTGQPITCVFDDCARNGDDRHEIRVHEPSGRTLHYLFCSDTHMWMYAHAHIDYGRLPAGMRSHTRFH